MKDKMIHIRLDEETIKQLKHLCVDMGISIQVYIEGLIRDDFGKS